MVLKQCHSRFNGFRVNHTEKWYDLSHNQDTNFAPAQPSSSSAASPGVQCVITPAFGGWEKPLWGRRRTPGLKVMHLSAVTHISGRGFTTQQAEVLVKILLRMTNSNMDVIYNDMVTKVQQEIMLQRVMSQIASVKKDMIILEKSEFSTLLAENEKLKIQLLQLKVQLCDVMNKVRSDTILDMNLEKSRVKELKAEHEKMLLETRTEIMEMTAEQDRHLTQVNMKIDTEVAGLKTMLESHKLDTIKYLAGSVFTCLTVILGFYRIWM
uniref:mitochondrial calcium uniporter regulator 1 isoform X2 n=1 Tax=Scatophagus argus TaxID=75038 RepID=UPI001ED80153|nr:mitochondrial calcium uniporter regulator 1 isoform X2 [Scatophagus argus]